MFTKPLRAALCAAPLALLIACTGGAGNTGDKVAAVVQSPAGASLLSQIETGFGPNVSAVIGKVNAGLAVVESDKKYVCAGMSMLNGLFSVAANIGGLIPAEDVTTEGAAMIGVNAACSAAVSDIASAVGTVASTYVKTADALKTAGVPVATP